MKSKYLTMNHTLSQTPGANMFNNFPSNIFDILCIKIYISFIDLLVHLLLI